MWLIDPIFVGLLRIVLFGFFIYFIFKKVLNYHYPKDFLNNIVLQFVKYTGIVLILMFFTIQLGAYDLMGFYLTLFIFMLINFFEIKSFKSAIDDVKLKIKSILIFSIRNREQEKKVTSFHKNSSKKENKKGVFTFWIIMAIAIIMIVSRYILYQYDSYLFTSRWAADLEKVKSFSDQKWFPQDLTMSGGFALINIYSKLTGISPEMALQSFGFVQAFLSVFILFWFIGKITKSQIVAPTFTTLLFAVSPLVIPISHNAITQQNPVFLAMFLALVIMILAVKPKLLSTNLKRYITFVIVILLAIGLIDLFTLLILLPPFLILAFFFYDAKYYKYYYLTFGAYLLAVIIVFSLYGSMAYYRGLSFEGFIMSNLLTSNVYTYLPSHILPFTELLQVYLYLSFLNIFLVIISVLIKRDVKFWKNALLFNFYFVIILLLKSLNIFWIDQDLLNLALVLYVPIVLGITVGLIYTLIVNIFKYNIRFKKSKYGFGISIIFIVVVVIFMFFGDKIFFKQSDHPSNKHSKTVLEAYHKIGKDYLPFSYSVVNNYQSNIISKGMHFAITYDYFMNKYLQKDSIYFGHLEDKKFFKENPNALLSKSVFVFIHDTDKISDNESQFRRDMSAVYKTLDILKQRGRKIELIIENETLKVYEIINQPDESKIEEIIF